MDGLTIDRFQTDGRGSVSGLGGVLPDFMIRDRIKIVPFVDAAVDAGVVSYGLTSYGYDCRVGYKFKVFTPALCAVVDPKRLPPEAFVDVDLTPDGPHDLPSECGLSRRCRRCGAVPGADAGEACPASKPDHILIPPNSFALAETIEWFDIPRDVLAVCVGKSTYARCGIIVSVTPLEPEWRGRVTVEISNTTPLPAKIYAGEGIMQVLFVPGVAACRVSYADKKGRYQDQAGLVLPFVKGFGHDRG